MAKGNWGINFDGFTELSEKYQKLGGDLKEITDECLTFIPQKINPGLKSAIAKHKRTGNTEKSLQTGQRVQWANDVGTIKVGFDISHGGLASIFLMYGTPRHIISNQYGTPKRAEAKEHPGISPDKKLYNAIYGRSIQREIAEKQNQIYLDAIDKALSRNT